MIASQPKGSIQLILGPMFAGKSTELIRRIRKYRAAKMSVLVVKYSADTRYSSDLLSTHDIQCLPAVKATKLSEILEHVGEHDVIAIDERQFYEDIVEIAEEIANQGKIVVITALDGNFLRKPFNVIPELCSLADHVEKFTAICYNCFGVAPFSARITDEKQEIVIGDANMYVACCRRCWKQIQAERQ